MPAYKLMYFDARGRAEVARLLFAQAGVEFEDCRLKAEEFGAIKGDAAKIPLGQLPVLLVDGDRAIPQSNSIARHLARTFGLYGKNETETTRIDVLCDCVDDIFTMILKMFFEKDETKKAELAKDFAEKGSVAILTAMCNGLKKNSEGKGFFVGTTMTLADIAVFNLTGMLSKEMPAFADKYPTLKEFNTRMKAEPKIAAWLAKRPETPF